MGVAAMGCREKLETYFRENRIEFGVHDHRAAFTAQEVAAAEHVPGRSLAKVVVAFADGAMVMLVLPAPDRVDVDKASAALGAKEVRLAKEKEFAPTFPDCEPGAMPPFGNLYGLPVYVDQNLSRNKTIVFQAGTHTETMSVAYKDFERLVSPTVAEIGLAP